MKRMKISKTLYADFNRERIEKRRERWALRAYKILEGLPFFVIGLFWVSAILWYIFH